MHPVVLLEIRGSRIVFVNTSSQRRSLSAIQLDSASNFERLIGTLWQASRPPEIRTEKKIRFVCEQDGVPERELKALLAPELLSRNVERAYLARIEYQDPRAHEVALCVRGVDDPVLVQTVAGHFAKLFGRAVHLDILFISESQEQELARVCKPFYRAV